MVVLLVMMKPDACAFPDVMDNRYRSTGENVVQLGPIGQTAIAL